MCSPLLTCPLCSQPGFQTLDSLQYGLISAATRQVVCPVCHDILFGLDKFTIHLFSHSVQHQQESTRSSFPVLVNNSATLLSKQCSITLQTSNNKEDVANCKEFSSANLCTDRNPGSSICGSREMKIENKPRVESIGIKQNLKTNSSMNEVPKKFRCEKLEINAVWDNQMIKSSAQNETQTQNKDPTIPNIHTQTTEAAKSLQTNSENMETSIGNRSLEHSSVCLPYHFTANIKKPPQNVSVQCSSQTSLKEKSSAESQQKDIIRCDICGFAFDDSSILMIHHQLVHCVDNKKEALHQSGGSKQGRVVDEKRQFPCHLCSKAFKMRGSLMVHLRVAHSSGVGAGKSFITRVDSDNYTDDRKFNCHLCSKSFKKEQHLLQHVKTHEGKQWECEVCSKLFTTKYFLKKHKRLHTGETPYSCDTCGKTFTFQQSYHKHLLYHSDDKPHVCTECDRAFKELSTLHNHQRIHTGEKPFACETCGKCFRQRVSYLVHRRIHTGVMPYQCTACGKNFRYKVSQRTHKCPSQPPGTVVRQSSDLVQKLLQGVQQKAVTNNSQILPPPHTTSVNSGDKDNPGDKHQASNPGSELQHFSTPHQFNSNQFTIVVGSDVQSVFPSSHIILAPGSVYGLPSSNTHMVCTSTSDNVEKPDAQGIVVQMGEIGIINSKMIDQIDFKKDKNEHEEKMNKSQHGSSDINIGNPKQNIYEQLTDTASDSSRQNLLTTERKKEEPIPKEKPHESLFLQEKQNDISSNENISASNSTDFWKTNKPNKPESSDLVVETTDFFSMVMSPSVKNLPSPSERLKHLTLSSPIDGLLRYEDDGIYQYLLNSDITASHSNVEKKTDDSGFSSGEPAVSTNRESEGSESLQNYSNSNGGTSSEPLLPG